MNQARWSSFWAEGRAARLEDELRRQGNVFGFSPQAFAPFLATLAVPPPVTTLEGLQGAGLGELVDALIISSPGLVRVLTLVPDTPAVVASLEEELTTLPGVRLVSQSRFGDQRRRSDHS